MSVLEQFFQISVVIILISVGMNLMLNSFGPSMTGQNIYNQEMVVSWESAESQVQQQTGTTTMSPSLITATLGIANTELSAQFFAIQRVIYVLLAPYDSPGCALTTPSTCTLTTFAIGLNVIISLIQLMAAAYLVVATAAVIFGGGAP